MLRKLLVDTRDQPVLRRRFLPWNDCRWNGAPAAAAPLPVPLPFPFRFPPPYRALDLPPPPPSPTSSPFLLRRWSEDLTFPPKAGRLRPLDRGYQRRQAPSSPDGFISVFFFAGSRDRAFFQAFVVRNRLETPQDWIDTAMVLHILCESYLWATTTMAEAFQQRHQQDGEQRRPRVTIN